MLYTLIVQSNSYSALESAREIAAKHKLNLIFFLFDAVYLANKFIDIPTDEANLSQLWQDFANMHNAPLVVCTASGARRGITNATIASGFTIGSIGQLVDACDNATKVVTL